MTFHDGTDFDAEAVKFNYERWKELPTRPPGNAYWPAAIFGGYGESSNIASVDVVGPLEVAINLRNPNSNFLFEQVYPAFGISSPAALMEGKADNSVTDISQIPYAQGGSPAMVGTGPLMFEEWVTGDHLTLNRNSSYWDPARMARVDSVIFRTIVEGTQRLELLQVGDIDLTEAIAPADFDTVSNNDELQLVDRGEPCASGQLYLNHNYSPVNDLTVRQAILPRREQGCPKRRLLQRPRCAVGQLAAAIRPVLRSAGAAPI